MHNRSRMMAMCLDRPAASRRGNGRPRSRTARHGTIETLEHRDDLVPTNVDTQTYIFPVEVVWQDGSDLVSARWGHAGPDGEVDPKVRNHPDPESRLMVDDLLTIPAVSLVMNFDEMFGEGGIYIAGQGAERATSVELINPDGSDGFQIDASVQIVGGSSTRRWKSDKLSMRLKFNQEFGSGDLEFPIFGDAATDRFDTLVLDAHSNNVWHHSEGIDVLGQRGRSQYPRDAFTSDLRRATGGLSPHREFVQLYTNGIYWGMQEFVGFSWSTMPQQREGPFVLWQLSLLSRRKRRNQIRARKVSYIRDVPNYYLGNQRPGKT